MGEPIILEGLGDRLTIVEAALTRIRGVLGLALFPTIKLGTDGQFPPPPGSGVTFDTVDHTDLIELQRTDQCKTRIAVTAKYTRQAIRVTPNPPPPERVRTCISYKIDITVAVTEICNPGGTTEKGTATHTTFKEYCDDATDSVKTGESTGFDGVKTDTLAYDHGTKVKAEQSGAKVTVTVTWPDGTTTTLPVG
jgi:hypothetical protein